MPKKSQQSRVKFWQRQVNEANRAFKEWSDEYRVSELESIYAGPGQEDREDGRKYVINKIFPTVEVGLPGLYYYNPVYKIDPRPTKADDMYTEVDQRAKLQEDTLNTFVTDPNMYFHDITTLSLKEHFFYYGIVEVGYTADLIDNPLLMKPELTPDEEIFAGLEKIPNPDNDQPESLYIKRIPARCWRVPANSHNITELNEWVGYYEWVRIQDVKANPRYKNTSKLKVGGKQNDLLSDADEKEDLDADGTGHRDMIKVWKIWNMRGKTKIVFPDCGDKFFVDNEPYDVFPFADYRRYQLTDTWYPIPPIYNWLYPQEEINDIRNKRRIYRKRANRRFTYRDGAIDPEEIEKLESDEDGVYAPAYSDNPISEVPNAMLDPPLFRDEQVLDQDFREISGIGGDQRGTENKDTTATQANIVEANKRIRESYQREKVGMWLSKIGTIMLKLIRVRMQLPFWIKRNVDLSSPYAAMDAMRVAKQWQQITSEDLGDLQLDISVDVRSLSPLTEEGERMNWMQVLALLSNPQLLSVLLPSELMLRKTLAFYGITSQNEINEFRKAGMMMLQMMQQAANNAEMGGNADSKQQQLPNNQDIRGQLSAQMAVA